MQLLKADYNEMFARMDYTSKKGKIGGDKRKITFALGEGDKMVLKVSGLINKDATVSIGKGLPNTSSKEGQTVVMHCKAFFRTKQQQQHVQKE